MKDKDLEYDLKENLDNGNIILSLNGHLIYLNPDGTLCHIEEEDHPQQEQEQEQEQREV